MNTTTKCPECNRIFDLLDETQAEEWHYGHDCEPQPAPTNPAQITLTATAGTLAAILNAAKVYATTEKTKYHLTGAQIQPGTEPGTLDIVATDAYQLAQITTTAVEHNVTEPVTLNLAEILPALTAAAKQDPKQNQASSTLTINTESGKWALTHMNGTTTTGNEALIRAEFPQWKPLFPTTREHAGPVALNSEKLTNPHKAARHLFGTKTELPLLIEHLQPNKPAIMSITGTEHKLTVLLMPVRQ
jgi:DNA polymerase III sliding clamp (beta) subunit (PCNA family)